MKKFDARITEIVAGNRNNLSISREYDDNPQETYACLLHIPDMNNKELAI